ncbi:hypothetical protein AABB24_040366, partial [Solanum stoloniferum]
ASMLMSSLTEPRVQLSMSNLQGSAPSSNPNPIQNPKPITDPKSVSFDEVSKLFNLPLSDAAESLGVCASVLKKICYENGLVRWPYRKVSSGKSIEDIKKEALREKQERSLEFPKAPGEKNGSLASSAISSFSVARQCWEFFFSICGISWIRPQSVKELLDSWQHQRTHKMLKQIWRTIPLCIFWTSWLERNKACFDGQKDHISRVKNKCLHNLFCWCKSSFIDNIDQYM